VIKSFNNIAETPFSYILPVERIAQRPVYPAESAKLLISNSSTELRQSCYNDIVDLLAPGDLLVFNHTKVSPARIRGSLNGTDGAAVELLLVSQNPNGSWTCLGKPLRKLEPGVRIFFDQKLSAVVERREGEKEVIINFSLQCSDKDLLTILDEIGEMPIPPYIRKGKADKQDRDDYQSIFAEHQGSIAAPTASLHFSRSLIKKVEDAGINHAGVVLHLGPASFLPIFDPELPTELRAPGTERYQHSNKLLKQIKQTRSNGNKVIAIGTSVVRALESMVRNNANEGEFLESSLFIQPGFEFKALDGIVTNFHQPGTTHLLLVEAFIGKDRLASIYDYALKHDFRFLSYGDGMILL
jgi:S-adenosylmethionine:tRNA ribosyltransferase-isomerase